MNTRLQRFISAENISQAQFADTINVARASVSHIIAGRNKPGFDFISSMARHYPSLNIDWLITGKGRMYKDQSEPSQESAELGPSASAEPASSANAATPASLAQPPASTTPTAHARTNEDGDDLLFHDEELLAAGDFFADTRKPSGQPVGRNPQGATENAPNPTFSAKDVHAAVAAAMASSTPQKQRKAVKVVIFYDDNTFQEF